MDFQDVKHISSHFFVTKSYESGVKKAENNYCSLSLGLL